MDVSGIGGSAAASMSQSGDAIQLAVFKKALDIEAQNAMQLVEAARQAGTGNPPHLGNSIDVRA